MPSTINDLKFLDWSNTHPTLTFMRNILRGSYQKPCLFEITSLLYVMNTELDEPENDGRVADALMAEAAWSLGRFSFSARQRVMGT